MSDVPIGIIPFSFFSVFQFSFVKKQVRCVTAPPRLTQSDKTPQQTKSEEEEERMKSGIVRGWFINAKSCADPRSFPSHTCSHCHTCGCMGAAIQNTFTGMYFSEAK